MNQYSKMWSSTKCNQAYLADMAKISPDLGKIIASYGRNGFFYVRGAMVSYLFINRVERELRKTMLGYFSARYVFDLFDSEFIGSLTESERAVLGDCVLLLIEAGRVPLDFAEPKETA